MKRLRRKSKNPLKRLKEKADRALQDWYRAEYEGEKCEACPAEFELMHHHLPKSQSNYGRYKQPANLIFLCKKCHNALHFGMYDVVSKYSLGRGKEWEKEINHIRQQTDFRLKTTYLNEVIEYYETAKPGI
jgi:5-methylcytosine-specific restriction endonuclease McrA